MFLYRRWSASLKSWYSSGVSSLLRSGSLGAAPGLRHPDGIIARSGAIRRNERTREILIRCAEKKLLRVRSMSPALANHGPENIRKLGHRVVGNKNDANSSCRIQCQPWSGCGPQEGANQDVSIDYDAKFTHP